MKEILDLPEGLPHEALDQAVCVMVVPSRGKPKMGERLGAGTRTTGPLSCRTGQDFTGAWSAPAIFRLDAWGGAMESSGYLVTDIVNLLEAIFVPGGAAPDLILLVMSPQGADIILKSQVRLGAHITADRGLVGSTANLALPQVLGYVRLSDGLFIGTSPKGIILEQDEAANRSLYGQDISAWDIIHGGVIPVPAAGQNLIDTLREHTREAALQSVTGEISKSQAAPAETDPPEAKATTPAHSAFTKDETGIPPGSKIYIYPIGGFESHLISVIRKKKLPLVVAIEPEGVDFEISGSTKLHETSTITSVLDLPRKIEVSIKMRNTQTGVVIFEHRVAKRSTVRALEHYQQKAAEECLDQLKKKIRKAEP